MRVFRHCPDAVSHIRLHVDQQANNYKDFAIEMDGDSSNVPEAVVAGGDDKRAVSVEVHGRNGVRVGRKGLQTLARLHVPDPHALVKLVHQRGVLNNYSVN